MPPCFKFIHLCFDYFIFVNIVIPGADYGKGAQETRVKWKTWGLMSDTFGLCSLKSFLLLNTGFNFVIVTWKMSDIFHTNNS